MQQEFRKRVGEYANSEMSRRIKELQDRYDWVLKRRGRPFMTPAEYRLLLSALHPDSRVSISDRKLAEVFGIVQKYKLLLVDETVEPTPTPYAAPVPKTAEEWMACRGNEGRVQAQARR